MPTSFAMKGYEGDTVGFALSGTTLEVKGRFHIQGRQPIGGNGAPEWVKQLFDADLELEMVAISKKDSGAVYSR